MLDVCATTANSKEQEAALEWFSNSQRRWRANCTTEWEVFEGRERTQQGGSSVTERGVGFGRCLSFTKGIHSMQIGYARSSTIDQEADYQAQLKALTRGCEKVFAEKVSSVGTGQQVRSGDGLRARGRCACRHQAGSACSERAHLVSIGGRLEAKGVSLKVFDQPIDTSTPTGKADVRRARRDSAVRGGAC